MAIAPATSINGIKGPWPFAASDCCSLAAACFYSGAM